MYKKAIFSVAASSLMIAGISTSALAEGDIFDAENFSATLTLASDYVVKGVSYSDNDPSVQGSFDYFNPIGLYAGIWGASWDGSAWNNTIELGYYAGFNNMLGPVNYDLSVAYWQYPGADDDNADLNFWEFTAALSYTIENIPLAPTLGAKYTYSPEYSGADGVENYFAANLDFALPYDITLGFLAGHMNIEGDVTTPDGYGPDDGKGYSYSHYKAKISTELKGFVVELNYQEMSENEYFGKIGDNRAVFLVSRTF